MRNDDMFCVSAKNPVWYTVRRIVDGVRRNDSESELAGNLESDFEFKGVEDLDQVGVDISGLDPVKGLFFMNFCLFCYLHFSSVLLNRSTIISYDLTCLRLSYYTFK